MEKAISMQQLQEKIANYQLRAEAKELVRNTDILLLVGISGAGKDTLMAELLQSSMYHHIVSHTTRTPRENRGVMERNGVEYHFIDTSTALHMLDNNGFVEAKLYGGNVYGTSVGEVQLAHDEGKIAITDVEVQGVQEFFKISPEVKAVFILPPSFEVWQQRLHARYAGNSDPGDIAKRLATALDELQFALDSEYFYFVINDDLQQAVQQINAIAQQQDGPPSDDQARQVMQAILDQLRQTLAS